MPNPKSAKPDQASKALRCVCTLSAALTVAIPIFAVIFSAPTFASMGHAKTTQANTDLQASGLRVPAIGSAAGTGIINIQQDKQTAALVLRKLNRSVPQLADAWLQNELKLMLNGLSAQAGLPEPFALVIVRNANINAFAAPGGVIGVHTGLITKANSSDELASVLAHEIAHVVQRHHARRDEKNTEGLLIQLGGLIAGILLAKTNPDAAQAATIGAQAYVQNQRLAYSRSHEREADRLGLQILQAAGYNPKAMPRFFETLQQQNASGNVPSFLLTHPLTLERISETKQMANAMDMRKNQFTRNIRKNFPYIYWRTLALSDQANPERFRAALKKDLSTLHKAAITLALSELLTRKNQLTEAQKLLKSVKGAQPIPLALAKAELMFAQKKHAQAVIFLQKQTRLFPESQALALCLARAYRHAQQAQNALDLLKPWSQSHKNDLLVWQALSEAAQALPESTLHQVIALRYRAEAEFLQDDIYRALDSLALAKRLAKDYPDHLAKINQRHEHMQTVAIREQ